MHVSWRCRRHCLPSGHARGLWLLQCVRAVGTCRHPSGGDSRPLRRLWRSRQRRYAAPLAGGRGAASAPSPPPGQALLRRHVNPTPYREVAAALAAWSTSNPTRLASSAELHSEPLRRGNASDPIALARHLDALAISLTTRQPRPKPARRSGQRTRIPAQVLLAKIPDTAVIGARQLRPERLVQPADHNHSAASRCSRGDETGPGSWRTCEAWTPSFERPRRSWPQPSGPRVPASPREKPTKIIMRGD